MAEGNSVMDEIRAQNRKMKGKTPKEKFQYFWDYYKVPTLVAILIIVFVSNIIYSMVTATDNALYVILINGFTEADTDQYMTGFEEYAQIDTKKFSANMETNFVIDEDSADQYAMANIQKFVTLVAANTLDVAVADKETFLGYAEAGYFQNLNDLLTPEQIEKYQDRLIYCDVAEDELDEEVPVGINVIDTPLIQQSGSYEVYGEAYCGIIINTRNLDTALLFLEYLETAPFSEAEES